MKKIISFNKLILLFTVALVGVTQQACKKDSSSGSGTPVIKDVRVVDSTKRDSFFTEALPGTLIVIQGSGFTGLQHVYFNDFDASFNSALNSDNNIIISIPADAPTAPPLDSVSNKIKVVTDHGEATFDFRLILPPPAVSAASNENAPAGTTITLWGTNFYGITKVTFPGGAEGTNLTVKSPTEISVTVPADITAGDSLHVIGDFGSCASPFIFDNWLSPSTGFLANFDGTNSQWSPPADNPYFGWSQQQWVGNFVTDPSAFPGGTGNCVELNPAGNKVASDNSWWQDNNSIITNTATWVSDASAPVSNYALKFEAYVKKDWTAGSIWIGTTWPNWPYLAEYAPWKTASSGKYKTTGWVTVTIPLSSFLSATNNVYTSSGSGPSNFSALTSGGGGMLMVMYANDGTTTIPGGSFDIGLDNFRIVKIK
ncbi:MAG TPA: glycan-binding surface protein [Chitinophagaceae bacterium]|nr:glycan-binding surface protein [Chitinophagaceae bacterium]